MKINVSTLIMLIAVSVVVAFASGYYLALNNYQSIEKASLLNTKNSAEPSTEKKTHSSVPAQVTQDNSQQDLKQNTDILNTSLQNSEDEPYEVDELTLAQDASMIEIIDFLAIINASDNEDDIKKFGPAFTQLHAAVKNNIDNFQILIDYYADATFTAKTPFYLTSALHSAEIADKDILLNDLVLRLSTQGTSEGDRRLLHLVSSSNMQSESEQIINSIKSIALYSEVGSANRTFALDLLMPYHLNENEKNKVVTDLSYSLNQSGESEVSYIIENIIRFSEKSQRVELAKNYLDQTNNFATRIAILSTLHTGAIKPDDTLKEALFRIAENPTDPLSNHARDALLYVFEINNAQYQRLRNDG